MDNERTFVVFDMSEIDKVDFNEVIETSAETLRTTVDGTKTFVKWIGTPPSFLDEINSKSDYYTYQEMLDLLTQEEWITVE